MWFNFSQLAQAIAPTARRFHAFVTSPEDGLLYMFAGQTAAGVQQYPPPTSRSLARCLSLRTRNAAPSSMPSS